MITQFCNGFAKTLEVYHFAFPQELDDIIDIGIIRESENVIIGGAGLLLCGQILCQIGDGVALGLEGCSRPRDTGGRLRINTGCMIDKVGPV